MTSSKCAARALLCVAWSLAFTACLEDEAETCSNSRDCRRGQFCEFEGAVGCAEEGEGLCRARPVVCSRERAPVCGCDGRTYRNACVALASAVSIASTGACEVAAPADASAPQDGSAAQDANAQQDANAPEDASEAEDASVAHDASASQDGSEPQDASELEAGEVLDAELEVDAADGEAAQDASVPDAELDAGPPRPCIANHECAPEEFCDNPDGWNGIICPNGGWCRPRPTTCSNEYAPACGCDRRTYRNACFANAAAVAANPGRCEANPFVLCDPDSQPNCEAGEQCLNTCGRTVCVSIPEQCPDTRAVVCGCDSRSYRNECSARQAGVLPISQGSCNVCDRNWPERCATGDYCDFDKRECVEAPRECPDVEATVCGCDLRTYPSECHARLGGTNVRSQGPCELGGVRLCNAGDGKPCGDDEFCRVDTLIPNSCGSYDGLCAPRPTSCPPATDMRACLIRGVTTSSVCEANRDGFSTSPVLELCGFPTGQCGFLPTWGMVSCAADEYCGYADPFCGVDIFSYQICKQIPASCEGYEGRPVCTCGGLYANACEAARAGQDAAWMQPSVDANGVLYCDYAPPWSRF